MGELRPKDTDNVLACTNEITRTRAKFIIMNFHGFTGYDSIFAADIVRLQEKIRALPAQLLVAGLEPGVRQKLSANGLVKEEEIIATLKDALQYFLAISVAS